jgi:Spy/CpxP family protein refolding chaperone
MKSLLHITIAVFLLNGLSLVSNAQEKKGPDRFAGGGAGYGPRMAGGFERVFGLLTEEQRASFRRAMEGQRDNMRGLEQKSAEARREVLEAALVNKFDEPTVRKKLDALMAIDADVTMLRIKAFAKLDPPLTADQLEKLRNAAGREGSEPQRRKKRPDVPRDENGLPLKKN